MNLAVIDENNLQQTPVQASGLLRQYAQALLQHAAAQRFDEATDALASLFSLRGRFPGYALLRDIARGRETIVAHGAVFVVGNSPTTPTLLAHCQEAIAACQSFLGAAAPSILLQCLPESKDLHYTLPCFPGLAILRLSSLSEGFPDQLRAVQFHEVAHCFLSSGVRLLDEGLAHYFASKFAALTIPTPDLSLLPSTRTLLSRASDSMFGEGTDSNPHIYQAACTVGAGLIEQVITRGGAAALTQLFSQVSEVASDAEVVQLVEQAIGQALPRGPISTEQTPQIKVFVEQARQAMFDAWISKVPEDLEAAVVALNAADYLHHEALLDSMIAVSINQALLRVYAGQKLSESDIAHVDMLLKEGECLPSGRLWLWRGCRAVLTIAMVRPNLIKVATAGQQAVQAFNKAAELIPDDPDLLVQHATLLLNAPPNYGGDRDLGVLKLRRAMENPVYRHHAMRILQKYGVEVDEPALEAAAPTSTETRASVAVESAASSAAQANAPVRIAVNGLSLRLNSAFTLQPADFIVHAGERVGIVGRNGSGKTMLLETLLGLRKPDSGSISLNVEQNADPRQHIGGLLQGADLPGDSKIKEIMAMHRVMYHTTDARVTRALGLDELADRAWKQLSRGQKQRVMLWLALAHLPQVALLDEPSLGLDEWFVRSLRDLLAALPITLVLISHNPADLMNMDRLMCMADGRITDQGTLPELISRYAGAFKASILQTLPDDASTALHQLPGLSRAPEQTERGWQLFGQAGFDQTFRDYIERFRISAFSLEATGVEDFLSQVART